MHVKCQLTALYQMERLMTLVWGYSQSRQPQTQHYNSPKHISTMTDQKTEVQAFCTAIQHNSLAKTYFIDYGQLEEKKIVEILYCIKST